MQSQLSKAVITGTITGICGLIISFLSVIHELEVNLGLDLLFILRGAERAPPEVVVVSLDKLSAEKLNVPFKPEKWPRLLHAQVIENLQREGAGVIAFDLFFNEARSRDDDMLLANAISKAGNVVLVEALIREKIETAINGEVPSGALNVERLLPPLAPLLQSSAAAAPFPLPKVPVKVSQYWTFKTTAGDTPTLPVTVFQVFTLEAYGDFVRLLEEIAPGQSGSLPRNRDELMKSRNIINVMRHLRDIFEGDPMIANAMLERLSSSERSNIDVKKRALLKSLIKMYRSSVSNYINYYGPPYSITTIPYYKVLQSDKNEEGSGNEIDFQGKAVFIGASEIFKLNQRDGYYTVFSESSGVDISGVEIAATAFANLLEDMAVRPLSLNAQFIIILLWGAGAGIVCRFFPNVITIGGMIAASAVYLMVAVHQFTIAGIWYPLVVPLMLQVPLALIGSFAWKYIDINRERINIRKAFSYYLPDEVVNNISKNIAYAMASHRVVPCICLSTDAEQYTAVSEKMAPDELGSLMNKYFEVIFHTIKSRKGVISNVVGDSVMALWETPDALLSRQACIAALETIEEVDRFNESVDTELPTRIGIHYGDVFLGNIGALERYELRYVGDVINTATRVEGLNKLLGTRILLSDEVFALLDGFLCRKLGTFLVVNKLKPVVIHELISLTEKSTQEQRDLCLLFSKALSAFNRQSWDEASEKFYDIKRKFGEDRPSLYYLNLCKQYRGKSYDESLDGIIHVDTK